MVLKFATAKKESGYRNVGHCEIDGETRENNEDGNGRKCGVGARSERWIMST
jgi:hypothetical protein